MSQIFRVTGYNAKENICAIFDTVDAFEKLWQLSVFVRDRGFKIVDATNSNRFIDVNIDGTPCPTKKIVVRACAFGEPELIKHNLNGRTYDAVKVNGAIYIPDR